MDDALLSVSTAKCIFDILNDFIKEYKSVTCEKDKVGFAKEITECLQSRNKHIKDLLDVSAAKKKTDPKDFLIDLKMLKSYNQLKEFKPIIAALEKNKDKYLKEHKDFKVTIQPQNIDARLITDFVSQNKYHQWCDIVSSYSQRLNLFGILYSNLVSCSSISTVANFKTFYKNVLEKLYKKDDGGKSHLFKNIVGNSLDNTIDAIRTKMDNSCDLSDENEKRKKGIHNLLPFAIEKLTAYCTKKPKTSPNKKAIVADIVRKLEQAQESLPEFIDGEYMVY